MKISKKILNLPPYISTSWKNISSLQMQENILVITMHDQSIVKVPDLDKAVIIEIFSSHAAALEAESKKQETPPQAPQTNQNQATPPNASGNINLTPQPNAEGVPDKAQMGFTIPLGDIGIENINSMMQHNQDYANSPDIPKEILDKISTVTGALGMEQELTNLPPAEPHCNCTYCQISRCIHKQEKEESPTVEEDILISDDELKFKEWDITSSKKDDKIYSVTNPLNTDEAYQVYLGDPLGCTCGNKNCEHIKAVLNT